MTIIIASDPTGILKRDIIERAFTMLGMAGYVFGREPDEIAYALGELNSLMAEWEAEGIGLGYAYTDELGSGEEASGIARADINGVVCGLTEAIAAAQGKTLPPEAMKRITKSIMSLRARYATIPKMPFAARTQSGLGNRGRRTFLARDT